MTGSADISIAPDEITLTIQLGEYYKNQSKMKNKLEMEKIEKKFFNVLAENGIEKEEVNFDNGGYYWYYWWTNRRGRDLTVRSYSVTLDSNTNFMSLMKGLDMDGISNIHISNKTNKRIHEYRQEVKVAALKAAKEKAQYLLESLGEKVGKVLSIQEVNNDYSWRQTRILSNVHVASNDSGNGIENTSQINLSYEVKVKFEIQ